MKRDSNLRTICQTRKARVFFNVKTKEYTVRAKDATDESADFVTKDQKAAFQQARKVDDT